MFLCANIFTIYDTSCHHCVNWTGFPLPIFVESIVSGGKGSFGKYVKEFFLFSLIIDVLIAIIFSFVVGLISKFVWSRISSRRVKLK